MIIHIDAPDYLIQYILFKTQDRNPQKDWIDTCSSNSLTYCLLTNFRRPKGNEYMPEKTSGLKIRISNKLKLEKRIYLSPTSQDVFLTLAQKQFKDEFRGYMADLLHKDAFIVSSIKNFLETRGVDYNRRVYEMLCKDFYRWRAKLTA